MEDTVAQIVTDLEAQLPISLSCLRNLETLLAYTVDTHDAIDLENLYSELSSRSFQLTSLVNAISSAMDSGVSFNRSMLASKVYLLLLLSPNSPVFTLFAPVPFLNLLRVLRVSTKNPSPKPNEGGGSVSPVRKKKKKKVKKNLGGTKNKSGNSDVIENEGEEGAFDINDLFFLFDNLLKVMRLVHLGRFPDCLKALVQTVSQIPSTAEEFLHDTARFGRLCEFCSKVLTEALKPEHGNQAVTAAEILKSLAPLILLPKSKARSFALDFVVSNMVSMGQNSSDVKNAIANMPKYLVQNAPEKAALRALAVEFIVEIIKSLDLEHQFGFADYVLKMSQGKLQLRLLSVDLVPDLILSLSGSFGFGMNEEVENTWGFDLLKALVNRCSDSTAGVRAKALTNLSHIVVSMSDNSGSKLALREVLGFGQEGSGEINKIVVQRCMDEKAAVRKAALLLISKLTSCLAVEPDEELLKTVGMACSDPLVSIRKVAISALSEAFRKYSNPSVIKEWMHSVPRLITDSETSIQEECQTLFLELVLNRVSKIGSKFSADHSSVHHDANTNLGLEDESIVELLKEMCHGDVSPWVRKICSSLGKKGKLQKTLANSLQNLIWKSESQWLRKHLQPIEKWTAPPGAWFLLSEVSAFLSKSVDWEFLHHHWQLLDKCYMENNLRSPAVLGCEDGEMVDVQAGSVDWMQDRVFLLQTISNVSLELPPEPAADLAQEFLKKLEGFNMHSTEVDAHIKALITLCRKKALNQEEADSLVMKWLKQLQNKASMVIEPFLTKVSNSSKENTFLTPPTAGSRRGRRTDSNSKLQSRATIAVYTIGSLVMVCPSANVQALIPTIYAIITSGTKSTKLPVPAVPLKQCAQSLYINSWLTLGKICLADGKLAKRYLPLFVQELETSEINALRNNIVVLMADFCVRYTAMVDCYMPKITKCLRDSCELVRRQTFILLSRLLQRDYVKWRGVLFLRFLLCLVDDSEKIRHLADFLFGNILKAKAPLLAYNSFVEAIFVLNDCNARTGCANSEDSGDGNRLFCIRGNDENARAQRKHIYETLLKQMAPEHLLATFAKVCAEILAAASEGMLSLEDTTGFSVLHDAFVVLSCKEIRIQSNHGASTSSDAADEEEGGDGGTQATRGRAITQALRKGLIQNSIPIFIELKRLLESRNSPLIGSLMDCLRILLKDYKNEIDDMLVADRQLQKELIHDMQKYENLKAKKATICTPHVKEMTSRKVKSKLSENIHRSSKATAKSVLREVNNNVSATPLSEMRVPKLKSTAGKTAVEAAGGGGERPRIEVIESLRRRQMFESDDEN